MAAKQSDLEIKVQRLERRMSDFDTLTHLLKDEMAGLRLSISSLLIADKDKLSALEGHHQAYAAAAQRAELQEQRATRCALRTDHLEAEVKKLEDEVAVLREQAKASQIAVSDSSESETEHQEHDEAGEKHGTP